MEKKNILRIVVASPSDVQAERDALPAVIDELNSGIAKAQGIILELTRWETDSHPGFHAQGPQGLIDPILRIGDCDVLIGIFWKRFGTPTHDAQSGAEHEFRTAYEAWKQNQRPEIMVYFNQKSYTPTSKAETDQWGQVLEFKRLFPKEGLWWPYRGKAGFAELVRRHLTNFILQRKEPPKLPRRRLPLEPLPVEYVNRQRKHNINEDLLDILKKKLAPTSETNLIVLSGPGGVGKTATAQEAIRTLSQGYKDRVVWVGVRAHTSISFLKIIDEIIRQLKPSEVPHPEQENRRQQALDLLEQDATLVVIDDFETVSLEDRDQFIECIEVSNQVTVLLITRETSVSRNVDHIVYREDVGNMTNTEALTFWKQLIERRAQHPGVFSKPTPTEVIKKYGTNPFVLFVGVFTYVDEQGAWDSVEELALASKTEVEKRIFRRSFELEQVGDAGRKILLTLSLFTPDASREALAYVAGLHHQSDQFRNAVVTLKSLWLINPVGTGERLTLEKDYRGYAREYMNEYGLNNELQGRFVQHFVGYVETHSRTSADDFKAIEEEKENIFKALDIAHAAKDFSSVVKVFDVLGRPHNGFFEIRGYWDAAINYGHFAIEAAKAIGQEKKTLEGGFTCTVASLHLKKGEFERARKLLQPLIDDGGTSLDKQTYVNALHFMGMVEFAEHRYDEATKLFERELVASEEAEEGGVDQRGIANCTQELGRIARLQGRFDDARVFYQRSLDIRKQLKNADGSEDIAAPKSSYHDLGLLAHQQGEWEQTHRHNDQKAQELYAEALTYYKESLELKKLIGNKSSIAHTQTEMAELARLRAGTKNSTQEKAQLYKEARKDLMESLQIKEELADPLHIAYSKYILGRVALDEGNILEAQKLCDEALEIRIKYKDEAGIAGCRYLAGLIAEQRGERSKAAEMFHSALNVWQDRKLIAADYARLALARVDTSIS
jgi:tetratricopeptide (TPR) repeat protein